jgi:glycosyltransferase involved in cell wall biosynthesis
MTDVGGGLVVYRTTGGIDAIDQYSRRLVDALRAHGNDVQYEPGGLGSALATSYAPDWVLLQYNPFQYGRMGVAPGMLRDALELRRRTRAPLVVMVHEAWINITDLKSGAIGLWQRIQLRSLLKLADGVMTSTEALAREIGSGAAHVPIPANITPVDLTADEARERLGLGGRIVVTLFGRRNPSRALDYAVVAIEMLRDTYGAARLAVLNLGADSPPLSLSPGIKAISPGAISAEALSTHLWASDVVLLPFADGLSTRRTTLMAALAHGKPVVGLEGSNTDEVLRQAGDALVLVPTGDRDAFARAVVDLLEQPARMRSIGERGRRLYESRFDWPLAAEQVLALMSRMTSRNGSAPQRPDRVAFVAHDVGGGGGMELQSEQLVNRLLDQGVSVDVIARTCSVTAREGLTFHRIATPKRPASVSYPAFLAAASTKLRRLRPGFVHSTGAIVLNRVDVATVHYCHRAAMNQISGTRASRKNALYRINAALDGIATRAGEWWCYRPGRVRLLCAVSDGVAAETAQQFPAMRRALRTVPNGVDADMFRPDSAARTEVRAELELGGASHLAVFVGGDWERKGLPYVVEALGSAPGWHLAIAGTGDASQIAARARAVGIEDRVHLLGPRSDPQRIFAAGDAFVLPTAYETFSLVTYEAAACGLPLLVTRVSGVEDVLIDGVNGWFIARDSADIARRLRELGRDPALAGAMSVSARASVDRYSWQAMAAGYLDVYRELTQGISLYPAGR